MGYPGCPDCLSGALVRSLVRLPPVALRCISMPVSVGMPVRLDPSKFHASGQELRGISLGSGSGSEASGGDGGHIAVLGSDALVTTATPVWPGEGISLANSAI